MRRLPFAATVLATLAFPAAALAHVTVSPGEVPAGATLVETFSVPNERDDKATTKIQLQLPEGVTAPAPQAVEGWTVAVAGRLVTWTGGRIEGEDRVDFPVTVTIPDTEGVTLTYKVLQTYEDGEVSRWIGTPDAENPAPVATVLASGETAKEGETHHDDGGHGEHLVMAGGGAAAALVVGAGGFVFWRRRKAGGA
jgi:uncharacterized protein YcnI